MKQFSRYIFFLLAVFFVLPLSGRNVQVYRSYSLSTCEVKAISNSVNHDLEKIVFCEDSENSDINSAELEEDDNDSKFFLSAISKLSFEPEEITRVNFHSHVFQNSEKLFLLFQSLKLYC